MKIIGMFFFLIKFNIFQAIRAAVHAKLEKQRKLNIEQPRIQDNKLYYEKQWYHIGGNII